MWPPGPVPLPATDEQWIDLGAQIKTRLRDAQHAHADAIEREAAQTPEAAAAPSASVDRATESAQAGIEGIPAMIEAHDDELMTIESIERDPANAVKLDIPQDTLPKRPTVLHRGQQRVVKTVDAVLRAHRKRCGGLGGYRDRQ